MNDDIDRLAKALGLKLDEFKAFEERTGQKVVSQEDYDRLQEYDRREKLKNHKQQSNDKEKSESVSPQNLGNEKQTPYNENQNWTPKAKLEKVSITEKKFDPSQKNPKDLSGQGPRDASKNEDTNASTTEKNQENVTNVPTNDAEPKENNRIAPQAKEIGEFGEKLAKRWLEKKYPSPNYKVVWLNENGSIGRGYDFVIKQNDAEIYYYEVKSKIDSNPQFFEISGTQWNWARELYEQGRGKKYIILLVTNTGEEESYITEIPNPVELWQNGKIECDPVKIKLNFKNLS